MRRAGQLLLALAGVGMGAAQAQSVGDSIFPALGQRGLDVQHYDLHLNVPRPGTPELSGDVTLTVGTREPLTKIVLDLLGPGVSAAQWNGQPVRWRQGAQKVDVTLPRPLRPGETGKLRLVYAGEAGQVAQNPAAQDPALPPSPGWLSPGWQTLPDLNASFSEPHGTRTFLPCNDHPSDPATFRVQVTVPLGFAAAASGDFVEQTTGFQTTGFQTTGFRTTTFTFMQRTPVPTYALALLTGHLERDLAPDVVLGTQTIRRRDVYAAGLSPTERVPQGESAEMLRVLSDWFGPYPFGVYGVAVVPGLPLALETATLSTLPVTSNRERVRLHELAHQWFGNRVTLADWADSWLNEGFATYAELLWAESQGEDSRATVAEWFARLPLSRPLRATRGEELFDSSAYFRGALALHALRLTVGDAAFKSFLRTYVTTFAGRPVSASALLGLVRANLGTAAEQTLRTWVEGRSLPALPSSWAGS